ncbi:hypothetical protein ACFXKW_21050 [Streptomyces sp. NPDC059193]|uniref:hypothetical protein n=1 Tax=Streptomyces sp. NPDC059193 TaxID=3346763 RepID=UPI003689FC44
MTVVQEETTDLADTRSDLRWVWSAMDPAERRERLSRMAEWVAWLVKEYDEHRDKILPCWYRHPSALNRLTALYVAWVRVYVEPGEEQRDLSLVEWHTALDRTVAELRFPSACQGLGTHAEPVTPLAPWAADPHFAAWLGTAQTMTAGPEHPAPWFRRRPKDPAPTTPRSRTGPES